MKDEEKSKTELLADIRTLRKELAHQKSIIQKNQGLEQKQQHTDKQLQTLLNATTDAAFLISADQIIVAANDALAESLGRKREELIGKPIVQFLPADIAASRRAQLEEVIVSKKPMRWKDEHEGKHFENSTCPILDEKGEVRQVAIYAKNISEQIDSEKALRREKDNLNGILDAMVDGVYIVDKNYDIQYVNPALLKDFGSYEGKKRVLQRMV
jgi:PAS domain S-box-containing protein